MNMPTADDIVGILNMRAERDRLRAQRDALLAALKDCVDSLANAGNLIDDELGGDYEGTITEMRDDIYRTRKAIADVEANL